MNNKDMIFFIKQFAIGVFIGVANVVPGVSGGTIAVICNVYDKLILLSSLNLKQMKQAWKELLSLALGIGTGIILFAKLITLLYTAYPAQTSFFFIGVIIGSIPFLYQRIRSSFPSTAADSAMRTARLLVAICGALGLMLMFGMYFLQRSEVQTAVIVTAFSSAAAVKLAVMGAIAAVAMLIPGISGSFVLLVLGAYQTILQAVADFNIPLLVPAGLGVCIGLVFGARLIALLLERFPAPMYGFILGLVAGSVIYLYPRVCQPFSMRVISAVLLFIGYSVVSFFSKRERQGNTKEDL